MKVLHIVGDSKWGGGGAIILALADMAHDLGWDVGMLTTDPVCQGMARAHGVEIVDLDVIWRNIRPIRDLGGLHTLYRFLRANHYDVVHTHTSKAGFVGRIAARAAGVPVVIHTAHSFPFHEDSSPAFAFFYRCLEKCAARFCDRIVTVSRYHRDWGIRAGIADGGRLVAIPNGISEDNIAVTKGPAQIRAELGIPSDEVFIFTPGRLFAGKGLEYLIDCIPALTRNLSRSFRIVLAGDGILRPPLEQRAAGLQGRNKVLFLGFRTDIGNLLNACDIVVLPSLHEGLSIALLEAMAARKPIVATSIGGNLEPTANGRGAMIVPPKSSTALAAAITTLLHSPELAAEKAANARSLYSLNHTLDAMTTRYKALYEELTSNYIVDSEDRKSKVTYEY